MLDPLDSVKESFKTHDTKEKEKESIYIANYKSSDRLET